MQYHRSLSCLAAILLMWCVRGLLAVETNTIKPLLIPAYMVEMEQIDQRLAPASWLVPLGTENIALHKAVTSSTHTFVSGDLSLITDGNLNNNPGSWVELTPGRQWVQIDLAQTYAIYGLAIWRFDVESHIPQTVIIQVSEDPQFKTQVHTLLRSDRNGVSAVGQWQYHLDKQHGPVLLLDAGGANHAGTWGRYVRLYGNSILPFATNNYTEVQVFGISMPTLRKLAKPPDAPIMVPVKMHLPPPKFGSFQVMPSTNSSGERTKRGLRPPFFAPIGTVNVALNQPVTSSDNRPIIGLLNLITDGRKEDLDGNWVQLAPGVQWVQIDLQKTCAIYGIVVWHYFGEPRIYKDVIVQVSNDPQFVKDVQTIFNNDADNAVGCGRGRDKQYFEDYQGKLLDTKGPHNIGIKARYIRFYSNGNFNDDQNHYTEVEVYGIPVRKG